ncbi:MAG: M14 family metallopeptidase [Planctomycetota bacterium]|nr:M14 family metallopeptidase [Planctomycetota bacterium]
MRQSSITLSVGTAALLFATSLAWGQADHRSRVALTFDHLYNYEEISEALHGLANAYPELLRLQSIGNSFEGRDMWLMTINNPKTGADTEKPAMYIDGNIHGNEVQAAEVPLYTIWYLCKSYGHVEALTELLDECAFYILPMVNPDGRAHWFDKPNTSSSSRSGTKPTDNDNDGLFDEDGYDDLDGDGEILEMRRRTPNGRWKDSPVDPRLMVRCKPGEEGQYDRLGREGIDNDGDGRINEDGTGGYDMNRNWPADWQPSYIQFGAGDYPFCYPETRCIGEFIKAHPNIAGVQAYHNAGGMILRGPGAKYVGEYPRGDLAVYNHLGSEGEKMLPFYRYMIIWKDLYTVHGGFVNWTYEHLGIFSFTNELWTGDKMFYRKSKEGFFGRQEDMLTYNDFLLFGQIFRPWKPFQHPVYGEIELGGWVKQSSRVPPGFMLPEVCHRNAAFTIFHAGAMPKLEITDATVENKGGDVFEITVEVKNLRILPTVSAIAAREGIGARDVIEITSVEEGQIEVLAGGTLNDRFLAPLVFVEHQPHRLWNGRGIPGERTRLFRWLVKGQGSVEVNYSSAKAVDVSQTIELK